MGDSTSEAAAENEKLSNVIAGGRAGPEAAAAPEKAVQDLSNSSAGSNDILAEALYSLFTSFTDVVQGELQCFNSESELLKDMNLRTAQEYNNFGDFASGLRIFVERLKQKNETFNQHLQEIDGIDLQVTELEAVVSTLDSYTSTLHAQIKSAFADAS